MKFFQSKGEKKKDASDEGKKRVLDKNLDSDKNSVVLNKQKKKTLAMTYNTMDSEHKSILEPQTFMGGILNITKQVSDSLLTSHQLELGNKTNYTFETRMIKKGFTVGASVSSSGIAGLNAMAGIPNATVKGSLIVIPQIQTGIYKPIGGPNLSSSAEVCLRSSIGAFTGKVSKSPSGLMLVSNGAITNTFDVPIKGKQNSFTATSGCEYCHIQGRDKANLLSGGVKVVHNTEQPAEVLLLMNNLGIFTSSVMKKITINPTKDLKTLAAGVGSIQISPCCELQINSKSKKSCLTGGVTAQKFNKKGELIRGCTTSIDTNGRCCCVASTNLGKNKLPDMQLSISLEGNVKTQEWGTGIGVSW